MRIFHAIVALSVLGSVACAESGPETLPTGQTFELIEDLGGDTPRDSQLVTFHYSVYEGDSLMQSSYTDGTGEPERAIIAPLDTSGPAEIFFLTALRRMSVGDSAVIRDRVAKGPAGPDGMADSADVVYGIRVIEVGTVAEATAFQNELMAEREAQQAEQEAARAAYTARETTVGDSLKAEIQTFKSMGAARAGYTTTASGLSYKILRPGSGPQPQPGDVIYASYLGALMDGTPFDNSYGRAQPLDFPLGTPNIIPGWNEGFAMLSPGAQAVLIIPSDQAYGAEGRGPIPGGATLAFFVELLGVQPGGAPPQ